MSIIVLAPPVVNFCGADFSTFTPEDQNKLMCCFMENGRNGDETAKYVFLMVLADPETSLSHFLLLFHIFNMVLSSFLYLIVFRCEGKYCSESATVVLQLQAHTLCL